MVSLLKHYCPIILASTCTSNVQFSKQFNSSAIKIACGCHHCLYQYAKPNTETEMVGSDPRLLDLKPVAALIMVTRIGKIYQYCTYMALQQLNDIYCDVITSVSMYSIISGMT